MNLRTFRIGGVHPEENKITAEMATQVAPLPKQAIFPWSAHRCSCQACSCQGRQGEGGYTHC